MPRDSILGRRRRPRRGFVIVVVAVVIMLITLAAYGYLSLMEVENRAALARGDQLQAEAVAYSGRELLAAVLETPRAKRPPGVEENDVAELFGGVLVDGDREARDAEERQGHFSILAHNTSDAAAHTWRFGYENESARLHLATLLQWDRQQPGAGRAALMNLTDMDESTADAILDWVDADDAARDQGAESTYYLGLDPPMRPRNALPPSLDELLLVRGVTRERLFGPDRDASFDVEDGEADSGSGARTSTGGDTRLPWSRCLTVHARERDETHDGRKRILLNQPNLAQLHQELSAVFEPSWASFIIAYRQFGPHAGSQEGAAAESLPVDLSRPPAHNIQSPLELIGQRVGIPTGEQDKTEVFASPWLDEPGQMREYLPKLMDEVTVGSGLPIPGRINVNLAPREVLAAIPGFDLALAERIVGSRAMSGGDELGRAHAVWLLVEGIVDRQEMRRIEPYVTAGGDVARAQIVGYYGLRGPFTRFETVIDGTVRPACQVYYKDLRRLGRGALGDVINLTQSP